MRWKHLDTEREGEGRGHTLWLAGHLLPVLQRWGEDSDWSDTSIRQESSRGCATELSLLQPQPPGLILPLPTYPTSDCRSSISLSLSRLSDSLLVNRNGRNDVRLLKRGRGRFGGFLLALFLRSVTLAEAGCHAVRILSKPGRRPPAESLLRRHLGRRTSSSRQGFG